MLQHDSSSQYCTTRPSADLFQISSIFYSLSENKSQYWMFMSALLLPVRISWWACPWNEVDLFSKHFMKCLYSLAVPYCLLEIKTAAQHNLRFMMPEGRKSWHRHCSNVHRALSNFLKCFFQIPLCLIGDCCPLRATVWFSWAVNHNQSKEPAILFHMWCFLILIYSPETCNLEILCFGINRQLQSDTANTTNMSLTILISVALFPKIDTNTLNSCLWSFSCFAACILLLMQICVLCLKARYIQWYIIKYKVLLFWSALQQSKTRV